MSTLSRLLPTQRLLLFFSHPTSNSHITLAHREKRSQNMAPTTLAASAYRQFHAVVVKAGYMQKTVTARIGDQMFSRRLGKVRFQFILSPHIPPSPSLALPPSFAYCLTDTLLLLIRNSPSLSASLSTIHDPLCAKATSSPSPTVGASRNKSITLSTTSLHRSASPSRQDPPYRA